MLLESNISSPFKFLNSYQKDDKDSYFGRRKETLKLFQLYKDSSLVVLHGPSGSGKTSLIYCGLLNRVRLKDNIIISIRRNENLIDSIKKTLFISEDKTKNVIDDQSELLSDFLNHQKELKEISRGIETIDEMTLSVEDQIVKLKKSQRNYNSKNKKQSSESLNDTQLVIDKNNNVLEDYILERNDLLEQLIKKNQEVNESCIKIETYFKNKHKNLSYVPLIIFDQFEELFVYGSQEEINEFGLFLKLIFDHKVCLNIIISLREEYFGHLDQLQSYIPHIFYKKTRLTHPDKETIEEIITKSFDRFNINKYKDHNDVNQRAELSDVEKRNRISLIVDQIKIQEDTEISYHLPFLQVYLDRLYKIDLYKTYKNNIPKHIKEAYGDYPPIEFNEQEIREFGSIENVLEKYIREVNNKILRNASNMLNNRKEHNDSVIKFLRHFRAKNDLKKRIPIRLQDQMYVIDSEKISNKIQIDIWGNTNDEEYNSTLSEIIDELHQKGILNISTEHVELSHDIIAKVISNIRIEEDFRSLIKKDFDSSFDIYADTGEAGDFLTAQQINRMNENKDFIIYHDDVDLLKERTDFFTKSIEESKKDELEKEKQNRKIKKYFNYSRVISVLMLLSLIALAIYFQRVNEAKDELSLANKLQKRQALINEVSKDIYKGTGDAFRDYKADKTSSFNHIRKSESIYLQNDSLFSYKKLGIGNFGIINSFKNEFYKNYIKTPFYLNSISLLGEGHIIKTKTRKLDKADSTLYLFALTAYNKLIARSLVYKNKNDQGAKIFKKDNVVAFEPFINDKGKLMTFIAIKEPSEKSIRLKLLNNQGNPVVLDSIHGDREIPVFGNRISDIEHQNNYKFLIGADNEVLQVNLDYLANSGKKNSITKLKEFENDIRTIKSFPGNRDNYLVLHGDNNLFKSTDTISNIFQGKNVENDYIYSFEILKNNSILLGFSNGVKWYDSNLNNFRNLDYKSDEGISAIDVLDGQILIGCYDKTASLWCSDNTVLKEFIGHTDAIRNVSFIDKDYIITSGEDQTIKVWIIKPVAVASNKMDGEIAEIQFKELNEVLISYGKKNNINTKILTNDLSESDDSIVNQEIPLVEQKPAAVNSLNITQRGNMVLDNTDIITGVNVIKYNTIRKIIAIASDDNQIYIYKNNKVIDTIAGHTDKVTDIDFSKNGEYMVSGSWDNKALVWKIDQSNHFKKIAELTFHTGDIEDVEFYDNSMLLTASNDKTVQIYKFKNDKFEQIPSLIRHNSIVTAATFSLDGKYIISGDSNGNIKKWDFLHFDKEIEKRTIDTDVLQESP